MHVGQAKSNLIVAFSGSLDYANLYATLSVEVSLGQIATRSKSSFDEIDVNVPAWKKVLYGLFSAKLHLEMTPGFPQVKTESMEVS